MPAPPISLADAPSKKPQGKIRDGPGPKTRGFFVLLQGGLYIKDNLSIWKIMFNTVGFFPSKMEEFLAFNMIHIAKKMRKQLTEYLENLRVQFLKTL